MDEPPLLRGLVTSTPQPGDRTNPRRGITVAGQRRNRTGLRWKQHHLGDTQGEATVRHSLAAGQSPSDVEEQGQSSVAEPGTAEAENTWQDGQPRGKRHPSRPLQTQQVRSAPP